jgi:PAS domain S-box-containing protein
MPLKADLAYASDHDLWRDHDRFRLVLESLVDHAVILTDASGLITYWNLGAENIFGRACVDAVGQSIAFIFTEEDRRNGRVQREMEEATAHGETDDECVLVGKDGKPFNGSGTLSAIFGKDHILLGFIKIVRDQSDRRRLEEELTSYRARLEFAQSAARMGNFEWDIETDAELWNQTLYKIYEIPTGKIIAKYKDWLDLVHPQDVPRVEAAFAEAIHFHKDLAIENRIIVPGGYRWVDCRGRAIYDERGKPLRLVGIQLDITERKEAEEALRRANDDLDQFAAIAAHDLQEPLRMVRSYLSLLEVRNPDLEERSKQYLTHAADGAGRMQSMIRSLLELARIDRGELRLDPIDLRDVIQEVLENLGQRIVEAQATVEVQELPSVLANRDHMVRLFQNLIGNSVKYRSADAPPLIRISAVRSSQYEWQFSIADNGIGIAREHHQDIFDMFRRLHGVGEYQGFGIGLTICKRIIERHHGSIWINSEPGLGTTVHFTIPSRQ